MKKFCVSLLAFIKKHSIDCAVTAMGVVFSTILGFASSSSDAIVGIIATFFVEFILFAVRQETHHLFEEYSRKQLVANLDDLQNAKIISEAISLAEMVDSPENKQAIEKEISRMNTALKELRGGKRRIYDKNLLYNEQKQIIKRAEKDIITIHVVQEIEDLYRWDPEKMDKASSFFSVLYSAFLELASKPLESRRRLVVLPKEGLDEIRSTYDKIHDKQRKRLLCSDNLNEFDKARKHTIHYYQSIERIVADQEKLKFKVRFIASSKVIAEAHQMGIHDCIICDKKLGFEFSKSDTMDVRAYVLSGEEYINRQSEMFDSLWEVASEWK